MKARRWGRKRAQLLLCAVFVVVALLYYFVQLSLTIHTSDGAAARIARMEFHERASSTDSLEELHRVSEFKVNNFFRFRLLSGGGWLGHAPAVVTQSRTVAIIRGRTGASRAIQSWSGYFLSAQRNGDVGFNRAEARSAEMWELRAADGGTVVLWSVAHRCFVRYVNEKLRCNVRKVSEAAQWEAFAEPSTSACRAPAVNSAALWTKALRLCWADAVLPLPDTTAKKIILFGTPKPLRALGPSDSTDSHDQFIIANRTLVNWSLLRGIIPVVCTTDSLSAQLIENINLQNEARGIGQRIEVIEDFELQVTHQQPTYRGLFLRIMRAYPDAYGYVYSNMDILYTSSIVDTLLAVRDYHSTIQKQRLASGGWFVVGRRTNVEIPANWALGDTWERDVEETLRPSGEPFQSLSEDYFAVSHEMFDWTAVPDFIVGGTAFDNWVTTKAVRAARAGQAVTVEATATLAAIHQNHGENVKASHEHPKSRYNNFLAYRNGGWGLGHTTDAPLMTVRPFNNTVTVLEKLSALVE